MAGIRKQGRPAASRKVYVMPIFRKEPDVGKLARAMISVAEKSAVNATTVQRKEAA